MPSKTGENSEILPLAGQRGRDDTMLATTHSGDSAPTNPSLRSRILRARCGEPLRWAAPQRHLFGQDIGYAAPAWRHSRRCPHSAATPSASIEVRRSSTGTRHQRDACCPIPRHTVGLPDLSRAEKTSANDETTIGSRVRRVGFCPRRLWVGPKTSEPSPRGGFSSGRRLVFLVIRDANRQQV